MIWCFDRCFPVTPRPATSVPDRGSYIATPLPGPGSPPPPDEEEEEEAAAPRNRAARDAIAAAWAVGANSVGDGWYISVADAEGAARDPSNARPERRARSSSRTCFRDLCDTPPPPLLALPMPSSSSWPSTSARDLGTSGSLGVPASAPRSAGRGADPVARRNLGGGGGGADDDDDGGTTGASADVRGGAAAAAGGAAACTSTTGRPMVADVDVLLYVTNAIPNPPPPGATAFPSPDAGAIRAVVALEEEDGRVDRSSSRSELNPPRPPPPASLPRDPAAAAAAAAATPPFDIGLRRRILPRRSPPPSSPDEGVDRDDDDDDDDDESSPSRGGRVSRSNISGGSTAPRESIRFPPRPRPRPRPGKGARPAAALTSDDRAAGVGTIVVVDVVAEAVVVTAVVIVARTGSSLDPPAAAFARHSSPSSSDDDDRESLP